MHPDVPEEQAYFDHALDLRERLEANLDRAASLTADPKTAMELRRRVGALGVVDPGQAVAFGRIDADGDRWYIGRGAIWDESNDLVVVNWQAPIAAPFYTATPDNPEGLDRRRIFRCRDNRILDIDELVFRQVAEAVASGTPEPVVTDALLEALERDRSGHLADIVATIQAEQYDVISRDPEQLLIVQGAPGTGKTVVGLHRVSWLLFNRRDRLKARDVLVVGPNPGFLRYVSTVLPSLGDEAVVQVPATSLGPRVRTGRVDPPEVRQLKGDRRMLRFLLRGLRNRQRVGREPAELEVQGREVVVAAEQLVAKARQLTGQPHNEARRSLRTFLVDEVRRQLTRRSFRDPPATDDARQAAVTTEVDAYLDRAWPKLTPQGFLVDLLSSRRRREVAAAGLLTPREIELLELPRPEGGSPPTWSLDDVPLLDLADALLNGTPARYEHIVVDEAQDLSPMQFESIRRRSRTGWMTVLGDLAQATSPWAPSSWEEVAVQLRRDQVPTELAELSLGYRLPTEVHEVAMRLLPEIAPGLQSPRPLRTTGDPVAVTATRPDELTDEVVRAVRSWSEGLVGVVTPSAERDAVRQALEAEGLASATELGGFPAPPIVVLACEDAKGLEFDNVVVVEPAAIVAESPHGLRSLFVALTRPTRRLAVVHARALPEELGLDSPLPGNATPVTPPEPSRPAAPAAPAVSEATAEADAAPAESPRGEPDDVGDTGAGPGTGAAEPATPPVCPDARPDVSRYGGPGRSAEPRRDLPPAPTRGPAPAASGQGRGTGWPEHLRPADPVRSERGADPARGGYPPAGPGPAPWPDSPAGGRPGHDDRPAAHGREVEVDRPAGQWTERAWPHGAPEDPAASVRWAEPAPPASAVAPPDEPPGSEWSDHRRPTHGPPEPPPAPRSEWSDHRRPTHGPPEPPPAPRSEWSDRIPAAPEPRHRPPSPDDRLPWAQTGEHAAVTWWERSASEPRHPVTGEHTAAASHPRHAATGEHGAVPWQERQERQERPGPDPGRSATGEHRRAAWPRPPSEPHRPPTSEHVRTAWWQPADPDPDTRRRDPEPPLPAPGARPREKEGWPPAAGPTRPPGRAPEPPRQDPEPVCHEPEPPRRSESARPRTIVLNPTGPGANGTTDPGQDDDDLHRSGERPGLPRPAAAPPANGIDVRADPFAALDREMARALAAKLAEALTRYVTPALVPLVVDQMAEILEADKPRVTRTGKDSTPP